MPVNYYYLSAKRISNDRRYKGSRHYEYLIQVEGLSPFVRTVGMFHLQCFMHNTYGMGIDIDTDQSLRDNNDWGHPWEKINSLELMDSINDIKWAHNGNGIDRFNKPRIYLKDKEMYTLVTLKYADILREKR